MEALASHVGGGYAHICHVSVTRSVRSLCTVVWAPSIGIKCTLSCHVNIL